jgi:Tfp pilus assembly protein PilO
MHKDFRTTLKRITAIDAAGFGVAAILTLAFMTGVLLPVNARTQQLGAARQTAARESQRHAGQVVAGHTLEHEIETVRREIAAEPLHISSEDMLNQRLADLAELSNRYTLKVEDLKPDKPIKTPYFLIIPVRIAGHGSYQSCATFIHSLHQQLPDVDVRSFKLTGAPNDIETQSAFELQLGWFAAPLETEPQARTAPMTAAAQ